MLRISIAKFSTISASLIKSLRQVTGSPINDCRKALEQTNGDLTKATDYLKQLGLAQADKRSGMEARKGIIICDSMSHIAAIAEINCETDFVARTDEFIEFSQEFIKYMLSQDQAINNENLESVFNQSANHSYFQTNINDKRKELIAKVKENIVIGQLHVLKSIGVFGSYQHNRLKNSLCGLGGAIVELKCDNAVDQVGTQVMREAANNLAAVYLGLKPQFITSNMVGESVIENLKQQIKKENEKKTDKQLEFILKGKLQKYYEENVFEQMEYILDEDGISVREYLKRDIESVTKQKIEIGRCIQLMV